ncbi:MAG: hypothetical protein C4342_08235, partial [Armatimonadota bacterium]
MNDNVAEILLRIRDEASQALRSINSESERLVQGLRSIQEQATSASSRLRTAFAQINEGIVGIGGSLGAILGTGGLIYALKNSAEAAFDATAQMRIFQRTAASVGQDVGTASKQLEQIANSLGLVPTQIASAAAQLLRAGYSMPQVVAAFQAGAASALAAGKTAAQGVENVAMALSTGQSIYLNYIGISENIGPVINKAATAMRGASEEAVRQATNQAALNVILKATRQEVASLPDLLGGYAGAQNRLNRELYEMRVALGQAVLPALTAVTEAARVAVSAFNSLSDEQKRLTAYLGIGTAALGALSTAWTLLAPVVRNAALIIRGAAAGILALAGSPIALAIAGLGALATAFVKTGQTTDEQRERMFLLAQGVIGMVEVLKGAAQAISGLFQSLGSFLSGVWGAILQAFRGDLAGAWESIQRTFNLEN